METQHPRTGVYPRNRLWLGCATALATGLLALQLESCAQQSDDSNTLYGAIDPLTSEDDIGNGGTGEATSSESVTTSAASAADGGPVIVINCGESEVKCDGSCKNLMKDPENCGDCGVVCQAPDTCVDGACGCPNGQQKCDGACIATTNDVANCGGCGVTCAATEVCSSGVCASSCAESETLCGESCVDIETDGRHCGGCDNACAAGETCTLGSCVAATTTTGGSTTGGNTSGGNTTGFMPGGNTSGGNTTGFMPGGTTTGGGMPCSNVRPTGTEWDEATCDQWASETSECGNAWMIDNHYCDQSCGRC